MFRDALTTGVTFETVPVSGRDAPVSGQYRLATLFELVRVGVFSTGTFFAD